MMQSINYKYSDRQFQYRDEPEPFRSLPMNIKALGEYFRKLVDIEGGWLHLRGRPPADALRHGSNGRLSRSDFRMIKRAVGELLDVGYLELGALDADGVFVPMEAGDYLGIRDWIPAQRGMSRQETRDWYADREQRASRYLAQIAPTDASKGSAAACDDTSPAAPSQAVAAAARSTEKTPKATRQRPAMHRKCTDGSATSENSKGTELALFRSLPFQNPPLSPKGESAVADKSNRFLDSDSPPTPSATLAMQAIEWLNQQRTTPTRFRADSQTVRRQAQRWRKTGRDWPLLRKALDLRLAALKAAKPERWEDWATPATLFNRKLERFVEEAQAGHEYRPPPATATPSATTETRSPGPPSSRHHRAMAQAHEERKKGAERAFADVLTIADMVGADGDWTSRLRHSTARAVVRDLGWSRIVEQREAIRDPFLARYLGGPRHELAYAAA